jgi:hypothetical protein
MLLLALVIPTSGFTVMDTSQTNGITVVKIENTTIVNNTDIFIHYVNLSSLRTVLENIDTNLKNVPDNFNTMNYKKDVLISLKYCKNKLEILCSRKTGLTGHIRTKRGLINGLGSAINWFTGNMDQDDKDKIEKDLMQLENNQEILVRQAGSSFKSNEYLTKKFDEDVKIIQNNTMQIKDKLKEDSDALTQIILLNQISLQITNIKDKIEQLILSIELCRMGIPHHSILNIDFTYSKGYVIDLSTVACHVTSKLITYFIHTPRIKESLNTYCILSTPFEENGKLWKLDIETEIVVTRNETIFVPSDCTDLDNISYCKNMQPVHTSCINQMLNNNGNYCSKYEIFNVKPIVNFKEKCNSLTGYKTSNVIINNEQIDVPKSFSVILKPDDEIILAGEVKGTATNPVLLPVKPYKVKSLNKKMNLQTLELASIPSEPTLMESWKSLNNENQHNVNIIFIVCITLGIGYTLYHFCIRNKQKNVTRMVIQPLQQMPLLPLQSSL